MYDDNPKLDTRSRIYLILADIRTPVLLADFETDGNWIDWPLR